MKNHIFSLLAAVSISLSTTFIPVHSAHAAQTSLTKLQNDGFRACRAQGKTGFTAVVRGTSSAGFEGSRGLGRSGSDAKFSLRYCFASLNECQRFVSRAGHIISDVQDIRYRSCDRRG